MELVYGRTQLSFAGQYYRQNERLMAHWQAVLPLRQLEVSYEEMGTDQEAVCRRLLSFCGLDWDERLPCLSREHAFIGKNKVEVLKEVDGPPSTTDPKILTKINEVAAEFSGPNSKLAAEVGASGASDLKFAVTGK